jgi:hypothetical protein
MRVRFRMRMRMYMTRTMHVISHTHPESIQIFKQ